MALAALGMGLIVWPCRQGWSASASSAASPVSASPGINADNLAVVINDADPLSMAIGSYYVRRRHIPPANVAHVAFAYQRPELPAEQFLALKAAVDRQLPSSIQAYALTWRLPYRVECMSITAAFAFGFDDDYCASGCFATRVSPYFNSDSHRPFDELQLRPTMMLAAADLAEAQALIDRGMRSDGSDPPGAAYLAISGDRARDVRAAEYPDASMLAAGRIPIHVVNGLVEHRSNIMFYFIGAARVDGLDTDHFLPGAVADHLTSYGGVLTGGRQMSALRWLEAGATGSYGTVVEPCNFPAKFPNVALLMHHYLQGETLIEAYWKSVAMPGQGVFVGEPLAAPYRHGH